MRRLPYDRAEEEYEDGFNRYALNLFNNLFNLLREHGLVPLSCT